MAGPLDGSSDGSSRVCWQVILSSKSAAIAVRADKPPDRVKYSNLSVRKPDFLEIEALGKASGVLKGTATFEDYADPSFVPPGKQVEELSWEYRP